FRLFPFCTSRTTRTPRGASQEKRLHRIPKLSGTIVLRGMLPVPASCLTSLNSGANASTSLTNVDGVFLRPQAKDRRSQPLPIWPHARAAFPLQSRVRRLRQDPISRPHPEKRAHSGRVLQSRRRVRHAHGLYSRRRTADAPADRQD